MRAIAVLPAHAATRAARLLAAAGWQAAERDSDLQDDAASAVRWAGAGWPVLFMPGAARVARALRRIVVVHGATRGERAAVDAADEAAVATGAEIVMLHVPSSGAAMGAADLPFRMEDHPGHDWAEWHEEFVRRFCRCSPGVSVSVRLATGVPADLVRSLARRRPALVIACAGAAWETDRAELLERLLVASPCPVLMVPGTRSGPPDEVDDT